ncbi:hypothetical protein BVC71_00405 [Marivivens niveibacter]|uniref:Major facilitator superfamily (MFS) profile domain-containing protein n=1 Tax=Marivivens niveibacter TaxID=1930667 RepID=A0A251X2R3_9RHOB|nr:hypothetical protein BVC71_00405 [Marivivens niveibacter]
MSNQTTEPTLNSAALLLIFLTISCGLFSANVYYIQTLVGEIATDFGHSEGGAGLAVTMTQLSYGLGLLFVVPLLDVVENRRLMLFLAAVALLGLVGAALAPSLWWLFGACFLIGSGSVCVQVLVPYASYLAPRGYEGRVVGIVTGGLMFGIMLARPAASLAASFGGWRSIFFIAAGAIALCMALILRRLPSRQPDVPAKYLSTIRGMLASVRQEPTLRRRLFYQAALFSTFSLFWTVVPLELASADFALGQREIALFALAGAMSVLAAPLGGALADKGHGHLTSGAALFLGIVAFGLTLLPITNQWVGLLVFFIAALLIDLALTVSFVIGQRIIFALGPTRRGSLNGIFMAGFYSAGALGSAVGGLLFAQHGWQPPAVVGIIVLAAALLFWFSDPNNHPKESCA